MATLESKEGNPKKITNIILDMDGTLYQLDGDNNGFIGSSLHKQIEKNILKLICDKEGVTSDQALLIFDEIKALGDMHSIHLSSRYGISRVEYFDIVWNINPEGIVIENINTKPVLEALATSGNQLFILTSAPRVWQENVCRFLGIQHLLSEVFTGEYFLDKSEVFATLSQRIPPESIISVGDQLHTDILPAKKLGMSVLHIQSPSDLLKLIDHE